MRLFKTVTAQEEDILSDSVKEHLKEISNPAVTPNHSPVKRSIDSSGYIRQGEYVYKCATYAGQTLKGIIDNAERCYADALILVDGFKAAGFEAVCTSDVDNAVLYTGGGTMYVKCMVAVYHNGNPDALYSITSKLGIKR